MALSAAHFAIVHGALRAGASKLRLRFAFSFEEKEARVSLRESFGICQPGLVWTWEWYRCIRTCLMVIPCECERYLSTLRPGCTDPTENPPWVGISPKRLILTGFASYKNLL